MTIPIEEISQADRRKQLEEDKLARKASTFFAQAQASLNDTAGGRFGAVTKSRVTGNEAAAIYPRQPSNSPANQMAMTPTEPPLGIDINAQDPTGEPHEIAASIQASSPVAPVDGEAPTLSIGGGSVGVKPKWRRI